MLQKNKIKIRGSMSHRSKLFTLKMYRKLSKLNITAMPSGHIMAVGLFVLIHPLSNVTLV